MDGPFPVRDSKCFASVYADLGFDVGICRDARPTFQSAKMAAEKDVHVSAVFSSSLNGNVGRTALLLEALEKENKKGRHIIAYGDPFFQDVRGVVQSRGDGCLSKDTTTAELALNILRQFDDKKENHSFYLTTDNRLIFITTLFHSHKLEQVHPGIGGNRCHAKQMKGTKEWGLWKIKSKI